MTRTEHQQPDNDEEKPRGRDQRVPFGRRPSVPPNETDATQPAGRTEKHPLRPTASRTGARLPHPAPVPTKTTDRPLRKLILDRLRS